MESKRRKVWGITLYRDEPEEASAERRFVGSEDVLETALSEARKAALDAARLDPRWTDSWSATIDHMVEVKTPWKAGTVWLQSITYEDLRPFTRWSLGPTWTEGPEVIP